MPTISDPEDGTGLLTAQVVAEDGGGLGWRAVDAGGRLGTDYQPPEHGTDRAAACDFFGKVNPHLQMSLRHQIVFRPKKDPRAADIHRLAFMPFVFTALTETYPGPNRKSSRPGQVLHCLIGGICSCGCGFYPPPLGLSLTRLATAHHNCHIISNECKKNTLVYSQWSKETMARK